MRYVSMGDSAAVGVGAQRGGGYPQRLTEKLRAAGVDVVHTNVGESGAMAVDVAERQAPGAARAKPDLVTIGVGGNDLWQMTSLEAFSLALTRTFAALSLVEPVDVLVLNVPDLSLAPIAAMASRFVPVTQQQGAARVDDLNGVIADVVARADADARARGQDRHHSVVDLCGPSRREIKGDAGLFCSDGFHPSDRGYDRWTALLWPHVVEALQRRGRSIAA